MAFIGLHIVVPTVPAKYLIPTHAGVRAQALQPDGKLVDNVLIVADNNALHILNAPSPAATASLEIGRSIAQQILTPTRLQIATS